MMQELLQNTDVWVLISFLIFAYVAYRFGYHHAMNALDRRIEDIRQKVDTAEKLRIEAQELLAQYQRKHRDALKDSEDIVKTAQDHAEKIHQKSEEDLAEIISRRELQLTDRLQRMEENAIAELQAHAADLAVAATTRIVSEKLDQNLDAGLIEDSISGISKRVN